MRKWLFHFIIVSLFLWSGLTLVHAADRGEIHSGETKIGLEIVAPFYKDTWTFYGNAGDRVLISAEKTSGSLWPKIKLYPPDNGPCEASAYKYLDHQLEQPGLYTIVIEDHMLNDEGTYNISLLKIPGALNSPEDPDGGAIASGQTLAPGGTINCASDMDAFQFYGEVGDRVIISAEKTSGSLWPKIKLYPPDNGPCEASAYEYLDHQLEQPGLYTIVIEDHMLNDEGTYNISLTKIPPDLRPGIYNPYPPNGAFVININGSFRWDPVAEATGYDLYFGEDVVQPLTKIGDNLPSPSMPFPKLERGKIYYWHVVAKRPDGDIQGPYWWFLVTPTGGKPMPWLYLLLGE